MSGIEPREGTPGETTSRLKPALHYFDALRRIAAYSDPEWIREHGEEEWGLPPSECLEMAYENVLSEARRAVE
jgi:hypothetical protein